MSKNVSTVSTANPAGNAVKVDVVEGTTTRGAAKGPDGSPIPRSYASVVVTLPGNRSDVAVTSARLKILSALGVTGEQYARLAKACADADARNAAFDAAYAAKLTELGLVKASSSRTRAAVQSY